MVPRWKPCLPASFGWPGARAVNARRDATSAGEAQEAEDADPSEPVCR